MEVKPDGYRVLPALVRLFARAGPDVQGDKFKTRALAHRSIGRQATCAAELHRPIVEVNSVQTPIARSGPAAKTLRQGRLQRSNYRARNKIRRRTVLRGPTRRVCPRRCVSFGKLS